MSISYTGGKGKGPLGTSFDLPVLHIYRSTDKGLPSFTEGDRFSVSGPNLNDELVLVNREKRWYRLRNEGAFALFERRSTSDSWLVRLPNGQTLFLGGDEENRQKSLGRTTHWFVREHADRFGHKVRYSYLKDGGRVYLQEITYQMHASPEYWSTVWLYYEERPDRFVDYTYGGAIRTNLRLTQIDMNHGSRTLRHYRLAYEDGLLSSLLKTVTLIGEFGEQMPALSFDYVQPSKNTSYLVSMRQLPPLGGLFDGSSTLEDMNGDGLPDLLVGVGGNYRYYENIDGVWFSENAKNLSNSPDRSLYEEDVVLADIDGDGYRDVVYNHATGFRYHPRAKIENGATRGFEPARTLRTSWNVGGRPDFHFGSPYVRITDTNHDGRVDLLYQKPGTDEQVLNLGGDVLQNEYVPELPADVDFSNPDLQMTDFNGDGHLDFVRMRIRSDYRQVRVWYGLGNGRYAAEQPMTSVPNGMPKEMFLQDVNNDGQADLVRISGTWLTYYLNDGNNRFVNTGAQRYGLPSTGSTRKIFFADMNGNGTADVVWLGVDWSLTYLDLFSEPNFGLLKRIDNGMGMVVEIDYRSSTSYAIEAKKSGNPWRTPMPNPVPVISEVRTSDSFFLLGLEENVSRTTFEYRDGYFDTKEREFRGFAEVETTSHGDESHESLVTETHMHVGRNLATGADEEILKGKPWLVFTKDLAGRVYGSVETGYEARWMCQEEIETTIEQQILPYCDHIDDLEEHKEELVAQALQKETLTGVWEKTKTPRFTAMRYEHDAWGSVVRGEKYGEVGLTGGHLPGDAFQLSDMVLELGEDEQVTETDYIYDVGEWMIGVSYASRLIDSFGNIVGETRTFYDGLPFAGLPLGEVKDGLVSRTSSWMKDNKEERWIDTARMKYDNGLVVATLDADDNLMELEYDDQVGMFPVAERFNVEIGSLEFHAEYDIGTGAMRSITDLNDNTTSFAHDGLGRLTKVVDPMSTFDEPTVRYDYEYGTSDYPVSQTATESLVDRDKNLYHTTVAYSDGLGRTRLVKTQAEETLGGWVGSGWARFSPRGSAVQVYDSFSSGNAGFEQPPTYTPVTVSSFDGEGRAVKIVPPATEHGLTSTVTTYLPFETKVYDERDTSEDTRLYPASTIVDGLGRVRKIVKRNQIDNEFTKLEWNVEYDAAGNIVGFLDPAGNRRGYSYDTLGRMLSVTDPNTGHMEYTYDDVGNLLRRVDSLDQVQTFEYGLANRLKKATMSGGPHDRPDSEYEYLYDVPSAEFPEATNLVGKLSQVKYPAGTVQVSYDELDRLVTAVQTLWDGKSDFDEQQVRDSYRQSYTYNAAGQVTSEEAPGGFALEFTYNRRNLLADVRGGFGGVSGLVFDNILYDHRGATIQTDAKNGIRSVAWYDNRARLRGVQSGPIARVSPLKDPAEKNAEAIQHLTYNRTPTGLISKIQDLTEVQNGFPRFGATYNYDRLYQLIEADTPEGKFGYSYDKIQNLTKRTADDPLAPILKGVFGYGGKVGEKQAGPNQITSAGDQVFAYDAVGQMKSYRGYALTFDVEGRLVEAKKDGTVLEYHYDDTGTRKLAIVRRPGKDPKIHRYISSRYQIRDGEDTWMVGAGLGRAEVRESRGVRLGLPLIDELTRYVDNPEGKKKPLVEEYMDLDGDGDGFDADDLAAAYEAYWKDVSAGGPRKIWKYYLSDHLGGTTHTLDSQGQVVSHQKYHPYGKTSHRDGEQPTYGFAGSEIEEEKELGLVQFGARWYAPEIGRWVSGDLFFATNPKNSIISPIENGAYLYAFNSPTGFKDETGNFGADVDDEATDVDDDNPYMAEAQYGLQDRRGTYHQENDVSPAQSEIDDKPPYWGEFRGDLIEGKCEEDIQNKKAGIYARENLNQLTGSFFGSIGNATAGALSDNPDARLLGGNIGEALDIHLAGQAGAGGINQKTVNQSPRPTSPSTTNRIEKAVPTQPKVATTSKVPVVKTPAPKVPKLRIEKHHRTPKAKKGRQPGRNRENNRFKKKKN